MIEFQLSFTYLLSSFYGFKPVNALLLTMQLCNWTGTY